MFRAHQLTCSSFVTFVPFVVEAPSLASFYQTDDNGADAFPLSGSATGNFDGTPALRACSADGSGSLEVDWTVTANHLPGEYSGVRRQC